MIALSIRLQRDSALVIVGPQGCGKTRLARAIAQRHGSYAEASALVLTNAAALRDVMHNVPRTLIIDELPRNAMEAVKAWITNPGPLEVRKAYSVDVMRLRKPHLIFCTCDPDPFRGVGDRRFRLVQLGHDGRVQNIARGA